uniref:Uncharacterized protein n=1 Tax=Pyxicephalus adspersus TaxID=30357 RepID=A0AAV3AA50_PYXAD|nr:TPA: hypothetical protein GDO54_014353 [Pyxicephalus adspersus]
MGLRPEWTGRPVPFALVLISRRLASFNGSQFEVTGTRSPTSAPSFCNKVEEFEGGIAKKLGSESSSRSETMFPMDWVESGISDSLLLAA